MAPKQSARLLPLQQVAETREEDALRRVIDAQRTLAEREMRQGELQAYLRDYETAKSGVSPQMLVNRQAFVARLREAERMQAQSVEKARVALETERARWLLKRRDTAVLDQLSACYQKRERRESERQEQRTLDEFALRRFADSEPPKSDILF